MLAFLKHAAGFGPVTLAGEAARALGRYYGDRNTNLAALRAMRSRLEQNVRREIDVLRSVDAAIAREESMDRGPVQDADLTDMDHTMDISIAAELAAAE